MALVFSTDGVHPRAGWHRRKARQSSSTLRSGAWSRDALEDPAQAHRTIGEIAYSWGFSNVWHFGRRFKAEYGLSPSEYRYHALPAYPIAAARLASL